MLQLAVPIPNIKGKQDIEIEMTINGIKQKMHFVVEVFTWDRCQTDLEDRVQCIRDRITRYGNEWMIYDIGIPTEDYVPLTFVNVEDWNKQRKLLLEAVHN